jgi:hypothetical protein
VTIGISSTESGMNRSVGGAGGNASVESALWLDGAAGGATTTGAEAAGGTGATGGAGADGDE